MNLSSPPVLRAIGARVGWTVLAAVAAEGIVLLANLDQWWALLLVAGLTALKNAIAAQVGGEGLTFSSGSIEAVQPPPYTGPPAPPWGSGGAP